MRTTIGLAFAALLASANLARAGDAAYTAAVLNEGPLVYWNFDEPSGSAIEQILGHASGEMVPMGNASRAASATTAGGASLGSAASFDGTAGSRYQASDIIPGGGPGAGFVASQRWAVEFWIHLPASGPVYISENGVGANDPSLIYGFNPNLEFFAPSGRTGNVPALAMSPNTWHHVVAAFYGNNNGFADNLREFYIDGSLAYSETTTSFSTGHSLNTLAIGNAVAGNENPAVLMIDEYAIYELPGGGLLNDQLYVEAIAGHYFAAVPEPSSAALAILGIGAAAWTRLRRRAR